MNNETKENIKIFGGIFLLIIAGCIIGSAIYNKYWLPQKIGQTTNPQAETIIGTVSDAQLLPYQYTNVSATSTTGYADGGSVDQLVDVQGMDNIRFNITAIGSVSSSSVNFRLYGSHDSENFYAISTTTPNETVATSTMTITEQTTSFEPGTATSSKTFLIKNITGLRWIRVLLYTPKSGHLNLGAQAFIQAIKLPYVSP